MPGSDSGDSGADPALLRAKERPGGEFSPAPWLPGPHPQTLWGRAARSRRRVAMRRETVATPDADELILDHVDGPDGSPRLVVLHGLEGSSYSVYVQGFLDRVSRLGWRATVVNFRSCARDPEDLDRMLPNRAARLYHSGETSDLDFVVRRLHAQEPGAPLLAAGVSLGGNVLLKWLGERRGSNPLRAAAALSTPYDLAAGSRHMERGMGRLYQESFLRTLRGKALAVAERFPEARESIDAEGVRRSRTFWEFDDAATGPLHGFSGAEDYYARSSSLAYLSSIDTPVLCISAEDDPFLPRSALPAVARAASSSVDLVVTRRGGHIGFVAGSPFSPRYWAEETAVSWLADRIGVSG